MDALKKARTQYRRLFSRACNDFEKEESDLSDENKIIKLKIIEEKALLMIETEMKIRDQLYDTEITEAECEAEFDESENYIDRWRNLEQKFKKLSLAEKEDSISSIDTLQNNKLLRYPKIQLPSFNGDIRNWLGFWGQFQKIDKDSSLDMHDKFSYLSQAMVKGSIAEELIKSFPPGGDSYEKAINQLKSRFGKDELLIQVYVRDLLALVLQKEKAQKNSLRSLYDLLETKLRALEILGVTRDKYASMLFPLIESSLPEDTLRAWERYRSNNRRSREGVVHDGQNSTIVEKSDLSSILDFLQDEVEAEERIILASQSFDCPKAKHSVRGESKSYSDKKVVNNRWKIGNAVQVPTAADLFTSSGGQRQCIFCSNFHNSADCTKVRKLPLKEREIIVEKSHSCFLCLRSGHQVRQCKIRAGCLNCGKRHHILLCRNMKSQSSSSDKIVAPEEKPEQDAALANISKSPNVMLQTLMVIIRGNGKRRKARAIIDSASQRSYILRDTARDMKYEAESFECLQHAVFGGNNTGVCKHDVFTLFLTSVNGDYNCNFKVLSQPVICETKPPSIHGLCGRELSDFQVHVEDDHRAPIEILIGADVAGKLMTGGYKLLPSGLAAVETRLGWTIMGRAPTTNSSDCSTLISMLTQEVTVADLWTLDTLGITDPSENKTKQELQEAAKSHFENTVKVEEDRFVVHLPWISDHPPLPDNFNLALKRLEGTARKLKEENLYEDYNQVFEEWTREGIIEEVPKHEIELPSHYLPHRHVVKENSTTRIRPVFDASAKQKGAHSLNDCLESGVNIIELIPNILYRFRLEKIGVIADIRKAFLQIGLSTADKDYLRFLWFGENGQLKYFRHCRVVFGVSSSPFLLGIVIQHHLQSVLNSRDVKYPENMIKLLMRSFYVDNCVTSVPSKQELKLFINVATNVMAERSFDLRGWEYTNFTNEITPDTNVLGMQWDKDADTLGINMTSLKELCVEKVTKKTILSAAHRIFDPIGVTCPVALFPKLLLQKTWELKLNWEAEVDPETKNEFLKWMKDIFLLEKVRIPRYLKIGEDNEKYSLHFFSDASMYAYAAVAFLRVETSECIKVQLLSAKARVSPTGKKKTTIARLELLAATITARLASSITREIPHEEIYFWTDSSTVLAWITREEPWGIFVYNRVKEIRELTDKNSWNHVPGSLNPADLPSRGCSAQYLLKSKWWEGPSWLYLSPEEWPNNNFDVNEEEILKERKKSIISSITRCLLSTDLPVEEKDWYYRYFSRYNKIVNLIAWIMRFVENCRSPKIERKQGIIDSREIINAEKKVIKMIQQECFENENDEKLKNFHCFKDQEGIIRLKTKLVYRDDNENFKTPIILSAHHKVVERLIFHYHVKNSHAGTQMLLNILREKFWILNGRKTIRSIIFKCVTCKRYSAKRLDAIEAPLPINRVREAAVFEICGIDLAGPLTLRGNQKSWVCLFTCAIYRAVHLELLTALSTEAFLLALRRFIARRGRCEIIYCDNGTNFVGASNSFKALDWNRIVSDSALRPIEWKFNPPTASWWGGWWERLIGIMKKLLRKVLGQASLTYEEMSTVLCDCESIINCRPITYVSENDAELTPLSPSMFLHDIKLSGVPDCDAVDNKSLNKRIKYRRELQNNLRKRFRSEYLGALLQRPEKKKSSKIGVGDIVLIGSDNSKRVNWPLGKIIEIIPGREGVTRLVKLQTANGQLLRPIQRLYPLEVSAVDPRFISKTYVDRTIGEQPIDSKPDDCKTYKNPEVVKKSKFGRIIKIPQRLDL